MRSCPGPSGRRSSSAPAKLRGSGGARRALLPPPPRLRDRGVVAAAGVVRRGVGALVAQQTAAPDTITPPMQLRPHSAAAPARAPVPLTERLTGVLGLAAIVGLGVALSRDRRRIQWRVVAWGLGLR